MTLSNAILATLAYHDIFDYPLTAQEVHRYLIDKKTTFKSIPKILTRLIDQQKIGERQGQYFLAGRSKIVSLRLQRAKFSQAKAKRAQFFANILRLIPTVKLVAISGALAMQNSHKNDDIDLVIITSTGNLWTTRFLANILLWPFKRNPKGQKIADRACLNIFIDEGKFSIRPANLYLAHEIAQMKPLWDRDGTYSRIAPVNANTNIKRSLSVYSRFIKTNRWVLKFLPNWVPNDERLTTNTINKKNDQALVPKRLALVAEPLEALAKWGQLWYMRPKITTERIEKHQLFFHPVSTGEWVMGEYQKRLKKLKIL